MFPVHAQTDFFAIGEQRAAFRASPKLDAGTAAQVRQQSVYTPASWAACRLPEKPASPCSEKPIRAQSDLPAAGSVAGSSVAQTQADILSVPQ